MTFLHIFAYVGAQACLACKNNWEKSKMFDKIVVAICIAICVVTGAWGWWWENGPEKKDDKKDGNPSDTNRKKDKEDEQVKNEISQLESETMT